jgi:hypothetical protein
MPERNTLCALDHLGLDGDQQNNVMDVLIRFLRQQEPIRRHSYIRYQFIVFQEAEKGVFAGLGRIEPSATAGDLQGIKKRRHAVVDIASVNYQVSRLIPPQEQDIQRTGQSDILSDQRSESVSTSAVIVCQVVNI